MIKLSELKNDDAIITEDLTIYAVEDVKADINYFKEKKIYTTKEYHAYINAADMIDHALENESDNMYEDWLDYIRPDITKEHIEKMQAILDDILSRDKENNITYYQDKEIDIYN